MKTILMLLAFVFATITCMASDYMSVKDNPVSYEVVVDVGAGDVSNACESSAEIIYSYSYLYSSDYKPESLSISSIVYSEPNHDSSSGHLPDIGKAEYNHTRNYTYKPIMFRNLGTHTSYLHKTIYKIGSNSLVNC